MYKILATFLLLGLTAGIPSFAQTTHRPIKGLRRPMPTTEKGLAKASLRDMRNGAVVVVEDTGLSPLPLWPVRNGVFRLLRPMPVLPPAPWMDLSRVETGGNTAAVLYPLGWDTR